MKLKVVQTVLFSDFQLSAGRPAYLQIKEYFQKLIISGALPEKSRLPSTREVAAILPVSRNTVIQAYQYLEDDGFIHNISGQGAFVTIPSATINFHETLQCSFDWNEQINDYAKAANYYDVKKNELQWEQGMISFKSIAPDPNLFELEEVKRAFMNRMSLEGEKLLNYGYARGYQALLEYLKNYMKNKGVTVEGKELLITNGFTEALNIVIAALTVPGDGIVCENPTHNTALKIMRLAGLNIIGVPMRYGEGIVPEELDEVLTTSKAAQRIKLAFLIPSYHNPTGLVMSPEKRRAVLNVLTKHKLPVLEDGFNEELRYSGAHAASLLALSGKGNNVIYLGSFSKILFPGIRVGWIMADSQLIALLESVKRALNIHTSALDQALLYEYLVSGQFDKYLKKIRRVYRERHCNALDLAKKYFSHCRIWGDGGMHIFVELDERLNARELLSACYAKGVIFMPGDVFYTDNGGSNTLRLGISRLTAAEMTAGFATIGRLIELQMKNSEE